MSSRTIAAMLFVCYLITPFLSAGNLTVNALNGETSDLKSNFDSKLWDKAVLVEKFKVPVDYKTLSPAADKTEVRILVDKKNLYFLVKAFDKKVADIKVGGAPPDGFLNKFPIGDHIELFLGVGIRRILAFDLNGNKYSSTSFKPDKYCEYGLATRKTSYGWEAIVSVNISSFFVSKRTKKTSFHLQVARHVDHGDGVRRSLAKGSELRNYINVDLIGIDRNIK